MSPYIHPDNLTLYFSSNGHLVLVTLTYSYVEEIHQIKNGDLQLIWVIQ